MDGPGVEGNKVLAKLWLMTSLAAAMVLASCEPYGPAEPPRIDLAASVAVPDRLGLVIWVDALDWPVAESMLRAGQLPNIRKYLIDRGVMVRAAIASVPTITYPNSVSFNTGLLPGHHGVTDNKWFDRNSLVLRNYTHVDSYRAVDGDFRATTIYEALADEFTATILTPVRRGATRNIDNEISAAVAWFFGQIGEINRLTTVRFELIADVANKTGRWPRFIFAYFTTPDAMLHRYGTGSPEYRAMLQDVDDQVGAICQGLDRAGLLARTYITLVSDHGGSNTGRHLLLMEYFRNTLGIAAADASAVAGAEMAFEQRLDKFNLRQAVVIVGGDRHAAIHLRAGEHWWQRPTEQEIDAFATRFGRPAAPAPTAPTSGPTATRPAVTLPGLLAALPAVDLVTVRRGDDSVRVQSAAGVGVIDRIRRDGRKLYCYQVTAGDDPLGYAQVPAAAALMDGQHHDADAWLRATIDGPRPDLIVQLVELNDSPRSGDIALFARDGWDFGTVNTAGHGGLIRREVVVPWIWSGPGLPAGADIPWARTVDLMPTMLDLLGLAGRTPCGIDGRSIAGQLRQARPTVTQPAVVPATQGAKTAW